MKRFTFLSIFYVFIINASFAQSFLNQPIEGVSGIDYTIVNYVDWQVKGIEDAFCGTKTYDGHEGTDFVIRSFRQMDSGVYVLAAAKGVVILTKDSLFDRETSSVINKGLGNYIGIRHANGLFTYYGHLRKNSLLVKVGETVNAGQKIGLVGSSGNSTDPHLHFEVHLPSSAVIDPFSGSCGNPNSLWLNQETYDTSFRLWDIGMQNKNVSVNDLRERKTTLACCPYIYSKPQDSVIVWAHMYGLKKGKTLTINWYQPNKSLWFTYDFVMEQDWWYYYFSSFINNVNLPNGDWSVELVYDGKKVGNQPFKIQGSSRIGTIQKKTGCEVLMKIPVQQLGNALPNSEIRIMNISGKLIWSSTHNGMDQAIPNFETGIYIIHSTSESGENCVLKRFVE